ncbi:MAG: hypothetical protein ABSD74_19815 [Rhizomicrobium sp.]|jgi:hypothetical protein
MTRVLNFFCIVFTAFVCLALNHVSDQTRVTEAQLKRTQLDIASSADRLKLLQEDWEHASNPSHIQQLAAAYIGLEDTATVQVASLELLPRRGESSPLSGPAVTNASAEMPVAAAHLHLAAAHASE